jgi:hypothetical protein
MDPKKHRTEEVQHVTNLWKQQEGTIKLQLLVKTHGYIKNIEKTDLILFEPNDGSFLSGWSLLLQEYSFRVSLLFIT